jgi:hypothetical protein
VENCAVCGSGNTRLIWLGWRRCETCGSDSAPYEYDASIYGEAFAEAITFHRDSGTLDDEGLRRDMSVNTEWIKRLPVAELSILDAGCCFGVSRTVFSGWRWHGWDVARFERQDPAVVVADWPPDIPPVSVVYLREVIEHPPEPVRLLERLRELTLPDGWLQVQTPRPMPSIDAALYEPQHLRIYSPEALCGILWQAGWAARERIDWDRGQCVTARRR